MIVSMERLDDKCEVCGKRADFRITRTNDDLPEFNEDGIKYFRSGVRTESFCKKHTPKDSKHFWNFNVPDMYNQQI